MNTEHRYGLETKKGGELLWQKIKKRRATNTIRASRTTLGKMKTNHSGNGLKSIYQAHTIPTGAINKHAISQQRLGDF